jgi:hypothetical protein
LNFLVLTDVLDQGGFFAEVFSLAGVYSGVGCAEINGDAGLGKYLPKA